MSLENLLCKCINGGRCETEAGIARCECPRGFEGERCEFIEISFDESKMDKKENTFMSQFSVALSCFLVAVFLLLILIYLWRKIRTVKKNQKKEFPNVHERSSTNQKSSSRIDEMLLVHLNLDKEALKETEKQLNFFQRQNKPMQEKITSLSTRCIKNFSLQNNTKDVDLELPLDLKLPRRKRRSGISR